MLHISFIITEERRGRNQRYSNSRFFDSFESIAKARRFYVRCTLNEQSGETHGQNESCSAMMPRRNSQSFRSWLIYSGQKLANELSGVSQRDVWLASKESQGDGTRSPR